jgi:hypothetical protein
VVCQHVGNLSIALAILHVRSDSWPSRGTG